MHSWADTHIAPVVDEQKQARRLNCASSKVLGTATQPQGGAYGSGVAVGAGTRPTDHG